jgi:hypothetical protein
VGGADARFGLGASLCEVVEGPAGDQHLAVDVRHTGQRAAPDQAPDGVFGDLEDLGGLGDRVNRGLATRKSA